MRGVGDAARTQSTADSPRGRRLVPSLPISHGNAQPGPGKEVNNLASEICYGLVTICRVTDPLSFSLSVAGVNWLAFLTKGWKNVSKTKILIPRFSDSIWFISRCEYGSMFVQGDVILNVGFFFFKWRSYQTAACTTITTSHHRPSCLAVDQSGPFEQTSEELKWTKEILFWPFCFQRAP